MMQFTEITLDEFNRIGSILNKTTKLTRQATPDGEVFFSNGEEIAILRRMPLLAMSLNPVFGEDQQPKTRAEVMVLEKYRERYLNMIK